MTKRTPGRPVIPGLKPHTVKLDPATAARAKAYGRGNLSRGIRERFTDAVKEGGK